MVQSVVRERVPGITRGSRNATHGGMTGVGMLMQMHPLTLSVPKVININFLQKISIHTEEKKLLELIK